MAFFLRNIIVAFFTILSCCNVEAMLSTFTRSFSSSAKLFSLSMRDLFVPSIEQRPLADRFNTKGDISAWDKLFTHRPEGLIIRPPLLCDDWTKVTIGNNTFINNNCLFLAKHGIKIGSHMWMAPNVRIYTELPAALRSEFSDLPHKGPVEIEENCWICGGVQIFPGVTIGKGTVIGSGSIVTKSIPSRSIAVGFPCKVVKQIPFGIKSLRSDIPSYAVSMSERDKMLMGIPYMSNDPELVRLRDITEEVSLRFNSTNDQPLLEELFEQKLNDAHVQSPFYSDYGTLIKLGRGVKIGPNCSFLSAGGIDIGDNVIFEEGAQLYTATHPIDPVDRNSGIGLAQGIKIGANSYIGKGAIILPGITIGENVKILEGSVVTKDVADGSTIVGNPGRIMKQ